LIYVEFESQTSVGLMNAFVTHSGTNSYQSKIQSKFSWEVHQDYL